MSNYILHTCDLYRNYCGQTFLAGDHYHGARLVLTYIRESETEEISSFSFTLQDSDDYTIYSFKVITTSSFEPRIQIC